MTTISDNDPYCAKGATESKEHHHDGNVGLASQLGHRDQDPILKDADSDFPDPGSSPGTLHRPSAINQKEAQPKSRRERRPRAEQRTVLRWGQRSQLPDSNKVMRVATVARTSSVWLTANC